MRASHGTRHISGAERIVSEEKISSTVQELVARARRPEIVPDHIEVKIDALGALPIRLLASLDVVTQSVSDACTGRDAASQALHQCGVSPNAVKKAIHLLSGGAASSGGNMRGAVIMDARSAERLESDHERGIRASKFDWSDDALASIIQKLANVGLTHVRIREALALATKVAHAPGMIAELCWSDDPDYTAGYVSSLATGYVRFPFLKEKGDPLGGRVFFVDRAKNDMDALVHYLQAEPVLITDTGECRPAKEP